MNYHSRKRIPLSHLPTHAPVCVCAHTRTHSHKSLWSVHSGIGKWFKKRPVHSRHCQEFLNRQTHNCQTLSCLTLYSKRSFTQKDPSHKKVLHMERSFTHKNPSHKKYTKILHKKDPTHKKKILRTKRSLAQKDPSYMYKDPSHKRSFTQKIIHTEKSFTQKRSLTQKDPSHKKDASHRMILQKQKQTQTNFFEFLVQFVCLLLSV